ncbi:hypothetical protein D041_3937B, partial [Vibrio parahaemolyticus EKP-008]
SDAILRNKYACSLLCFALPKK